MTTIGTIGIRVRNSIGGLCVAALLPCAHAQSFPDKPIRLLVGQPPSSSLDLTSRMLTPDMGKRLGQPIVIENRVGAGGLVAANVLLTAPPDGYTIQFTSSAAISSVMNKENAVDAHTQLAPISDIYSIPFTFYISRKLPANTWAEVLAYAKANPSKLNIGSTSPVLELLAAMLKVRTGLSYTLIPYNGVTQVVPALISGELATSFSTFVPIYETQMKAGTVQALFTTGAKRPPSLPNVPTATELGIPGYVVTNLAGFWAPRATPKPIRDRISEAAVATARQPEVAAQFVKNLGVDPLGTTPEEQQRNAEADFKFWSEAARAANFRPN